MRPDCPNLVQARISHLELRLHERLWRRLFFEKFEDFVRAKLRVRNSREIRYGRENIVGVGVGWKNWPEGPRIEDEDYHRLLRYYRDIRKSHLDPYDWFRIHRDSYFDLLHGRLAAHLKNFGEQCVRVLVNKKLQKS